MANCRVIQGGEYLEGKALGTGPETGALADMETTVQLPLVGWCHVPSRRRVIVCEGAGDQTSQTPAAGFQFGEGRPL